jgi:hypothetical protein
VNYSLILLLPSCSRSLAAQCAHLLRRCHAIHLAWQQLRTCASTIAAHQQSTRLQREHHGQRPRHGQEQTRNGTCMVMMVVFATDCMPTSIIVYAGSLMLGLPRYLQRHQGQLSGIMLSREHAGGR